MEVYLFAFVLVLGASSALGTSALWFSAPITLAETVEELRMYSGQRPEDSCDDFMTMHDEHKYRDVLLPYLCEEASVWQGAEDTSTVVVPCDGRPSRAIVDRLDVSDLPLKRDEIGPFVNIRTGYSASFYIGMICSHTLEEGGCDRMFVRPLEWTGSHKGGGGGGGDTLRAVLVTRVQRAVDRDSNGRGFSLLHINGNGNGNGSEHVESSHAITIFNGQKPEDAIEDYLLARESKGKPSLSSYELVQLVTAVCTEIVERNAGGVASIPTHPVYQVCSHGQQQSGWQLQCRRFVCSVDNDLSKGRLCQHILSQNDMLPHAL